MFNKAPLYIVILLCSLKLASQSNAGFCRDGNQSVPVFIETFGTGETTELTQGTSPYTYEENSLINMGTYHVSGIGNWFIEDNTPNDEDGRALIMNVDEKPGMYYNRKIDGLCPYTTYTISFSYNVFSPRECTSSYGIFYGTDLNNNDNGNGEIISDDNFTSGWQDRSISFSTRTHNYVTFYIGSTSMPKCSQYIAIDDITIRACGENVSVSDNTGRNSVEICQNDFPFSTKIYASPNYSGEKQHDYQWQSSRDAINWTNILDATFSVYTTPPINETTYFRAIVGHGNILCSNNLEYEYASEIFVVSVIDSITPPISKGDFTFCIGGLKALSVTVDGGLSVDWYDAPTGGNLLLANSTVFNPEGVAGTYYAEAKLTFNNNCYSQRTAITVDYKDPPEIVDETMVLCENTNTTIHAGVAAENYLWNNGETAEEISVNEPGVYTVDIDFNGCVVKKTITLTPSNFSIQNVISDGKNIVVTTNITGDFLYSLDGNIYQSSNVFTNIKGGLYTIYVKYRNCNELITTQFIHFYIPSFFTPNGDGVNDFFELNGIELFTSSQISIFNRYGKLLKSSKNTSFVWDGSFSGYKLPSDDYWYVIIADDRKFIGHFTLKR